MLYNHHSLLSRIFHRLRREGFNLGVGEYLDALKAIEGGWETKSQDELYQLVQLLWCSSLAEQSKLELLWTSIIAAEETKQKLEELKKQSKVSSIEKQMNEEQPQIRQEVIKSEPVQLQYENIDLAPQPVQAPFILAELEEETDFQNYWLVSRRQMVYTWRYLRRPVADGREDVLDVMATVEQVSAQGFFLQPVYSRRETNHAHLLLLVDQEGSMTPFHRVTRDLVETAKYESSIQRVDVGYFHNIPAKTIYKDSHLTEPIFLEKVLAECDNDTSVLIISDAGSARGYRRMERVRVLTEVLFDIKQHTSLIAWLNPMPKERWSGTSAQILSYIIQMYSMDKEGLSQAINIMQGQPWVGSE